MRPILACLITLVLVGGVYGYIKFAEGIRRPPTEINIDYSEADFSLEIERSFDCVVDPIFAPESLRVLFKGESVLAISKKIAVEETIRLEKLDGVEVGENEIYIAANRAEGSIGLGAIKVSIFRGGVLFDEQVLTSQQGIAEVAGPISFVVKSEPKTEDSHQH
jgi:hypothetical protein